MTKEEDIDALDAAVAGATKRALKRKRISRSLSPGTYTVKAVFTPTPAFRDNYPVATMSKVITIRPPR